MLIWVVLAAWWVVCFWLVLHTTGRVSGGGGGLRVEGDRGRS